MKSLGQLKHCKFREELKTAFKIEIGTSQVYFIKKMYVIL